MQSTGEMGKIYGLIKSSAVFSKNIWTGGCKLTVEEQGKTKNFTSVAPPISAINAKNVK